MTQIKKNPGIHFLHLEDADAVGKKAAQMVREQLHQKPDSSIVFPTGKTPLPMYQALQGMNDISWTNSRLFQLDEYINPGEGEPAYETFAQFLDEQLWHCVGGQKFYIRDYKRNAELYEAEIMGAGNEGADLVILGIGGNGHIAFNEPGSPKDAKTRIIPLAAETLHNNFGENARKAGTPTEAITLGIKTILSARKIILLATGINKRDIVKRAFDPNVPPSADLPASWLKMHPDVTVITDFNV